MDNQQLAPNAVSDSANRKRLMTNVYTDVKQRKVISSLQDYKSSITNNNNVDVKRQSWHAKSQGPCLVTERVSGQLYPVIKETAKALQKYIVERLREN
ncbi:hypothetical protein G9C98_008089 [Cotesia typhae]|uniref:Uncharacterized protein n=1 Tax=Cotesia typhae TaxID=2053667 RepID=A0A8J5QUJ2_9HYME|nr:hypothetical protein G9C98_008089 [Cotesia typhae]